MQIQQGKTLTTAHLQMLRQQQQLQQAASPQIKAVGKSQVRQQQQLKVSVSQFLETG